MEKWKRLIYQGKDYGDYYLVSNMGRIRTAKTGKIRKLCLNTQGYFIFSGTFGSRQSKKTIKVHRAVAETFIKNKEDKPEVNHIDGNKLNNNVKNLEWCTFKENSIHAVEHNLIKSGEESHRSKLRNEDVLFIRNLYNNEKEKYSTTKLSEQFGVKREAIRLAAIGKSFKNV